MKFSSCLEVNLRQRGRCVWARTGQVARGKRREQENTLLAPCRLPLFVYRRRLSPAWQRQHTIDAFDGFRHVAFPGGYAGNALPKWLASSLKSSRVDRAVVVMVTSLSSEDNRIAPVIFEPSSGSR